MLEKLDVSRNPIGPAGVTEISEAARSHPALQSIQFDGASLPVVLLRGARGAESALNVADWALGPLSGHAIGAMAKENRCLQVSK